MLHHILYINRNFIMNSEKTESLDDMDAIYVSDEAYEYIVSIENELRLLDRLDNILGDFKEKYMKYKELFNSSSTTDELNSLMNEIESYSTDCIEKYNKYIQYVEQTNIAMAISTQFNSNMILNKELHRKIQDKKDQQSCTLLFLQVSFIIISLIIGMYGICNTANGCAYVNKYK